MFNWGINIIVKKDKRQQLVKRKKTKRENTLYLL